MIAEAVARPTSVDDARIARAWAVLDGVLDPEVPAVSVRDLGIVRDVRRAGEALEVVLTPTYSGCPATEVIERDVLTLAQESRTGSGLGGRQTAADASAQAVTATPAAKAPAITW